MTKRQARARPYGYPAHPTLSGAHIRSVEGETASRALRRLGFSAVEQPDFSLAAYDDENLVIGALATRPRTANLTTVWLAVAPQCRRLKVATDLFDTLMIGYASELRHGFLFRHVPNSPAAAPFLASLTLAALPIAPDETLVTLNQASRPLSPLSPPNALQLDHTNLTPPIPSLGHGGSR